MTPERPPRTIDDVDRRILFTMVQNGRIPNKTLSEIVGLAPSSCLARVRALEEQEVISGYHADVGLSSVGLPIQAMVSVRLRSHTREKMDSFMSQVSRLPGVLSTFCMSGTNDFFIHVAARSPNALRDFVVDRITSIPVVAQTETRLVFTHLRNPNDPLALNVKGSDV